MAKSKAPTNSVERKLADYQGSINVQSVVMHCREWRAKHLRKLEIDVGIQPSELTYRGFGYVICIRKFWIRAKFPDGEATFVRPPLETTAPIGDLTVGTTATVEREVGRSAEVSDSLKAIWNVRRKRALQNATSLAVPLRVAEQVKGVLAADTAAADWRVVLIEPGRLAAARGVSVDSVVDDYFQNLVVEAHAQGGTREDPTGVSLDLDPGSYFILWRRPRTRWGAFVDSLRFRALSGSKREAELIARASGAGAACELLPAGAS